MSGLFGLSLRCIYVERFLIPSRLILSYSFLLALFHTSYRILVISMERENTEQDEYITTNQGEASRSLDTPARSVSPKLFEFVVDSGDSKSQIRRHAMRESWRQRNHSRSKSPVAHMLQHKARELLPKVVQTRHDSSSTGKEAQIAESSDVELQEGVGRRSENSSSSGSESPGSDNVKRDRLLIPDGVSSDLTFDRPWRQH